MPFKTKKRKKSATIRRVAISQQGLAVYESEDISSNNGVDGAEIKPEKVKYYTRKHDYVKGEVFKISILALIIIGLQFALRILI